MWLEETFNKESQVRMSMKSAGTDDKSTQVHKRMADKEEVGTSLQNARAKCGQALFEG